LKQLTHQNAIDGEEDGHLVVGTQHKAATKNISAAIQYWLNGPSRPFELVRITGKKAVIAFLLHEISAWSFANQHTRFNGIIGQANEKSPEFY
jgi:hypothetical protein